MVADQKTTHVGKLRVRSDARDKLSLQLTLNRTLSALNLHPAGLPSSAVVFVRRLHDPAPGIVRTDDTAAVPYAWGQAVAASLDRLVTQAARPAQGHVGSNADAVLFIDRSELLACLAADWCDGTAITRWWWQTLFRATDMASAVFSEWLACIEWAPAALNHLAKNRLAGRFVRTIGEARSRALLASVVERFGLVELATLNHAAQPSGSASFTALVKRARSRSSILSRTDAVVSPNQSPFLECAPESLDLGLNMEQQCFLGIGIMLARAPAVVRSSAFAGRLLEWRETELLGLSTFETYEVPPIEPQTARGGETVSDKVKTRPPTSAVRRDLASLHSSGEVEDEARTPPRAAPPDIVFNAFETTSNMPLPFADVRDDEIDAEPVRDLSYPVGAEPKGLRDNECHQLAPADHEISDADRAIEEATDLERIEAKTEMGGVFYLINAALYLKLYGDFTTPLEPGLPLSIWDFLALVGAELIGEKLKSDPLWPLLAKLSGRGESEPGGCFEPPHEWRLPTEWLEPFEERAVCKWYLSCGRLTAEHPAGFFVFDVDSTQGNPSLKLACETAPYAGRLVLKRGRHLGNRQNKSSLDRWTSSTAAYLRARLVRALGLDATADLTSILFQSRARVSVTPARLDLFFSLAELPVQVRLSGLDRNPGWVPAAGRTVAFHYE